VPDAANPRIRPRPDRIIGLTVPGTAFGSDEMSGDFRARKTLGLEAWKVMRWEMLRRTVATNGVAPWLVVAMS